MREIPLTKGLVVTVDDEDYDRLVAFGPWYADKASHAWYAVKQTPGVRGRKIRMHNFIMQPPIGFWVDHVERTDTLNNCRTNLRIATRSQNCANRRGWSETKLRGAYREARCSTFWAAITINGKHTRLGNFKTLEEAARAYDAAALAHFGEFAVLNFPGNN